MKKIYIITGHYGTGKTNFSVNLAMLHAKRKEKVAVIDADTVNPYFRTADFENLFAQNNISLYSTMYANTNLDIPAVNFDIDAVIHNHDCTIIDVGGDDTGAVILGRYRNTLKKYNNTEMLYVINKYRDIGSNAEDYVKLMKEIERFAGMKHTGIVNNSNTGSFTSADDIISSVSFAESVSKLSEVPVYCHTADISLKCNVLDRFAEYIKIHVKNIF